MSNKNIEFSCGCKFKINDNNNIVFDPDIENLNLDCKRTWDLIGAGNTKGVFQLESRLGRSLAKKLKPESIEHLSGLLAILRPGCLEAIRDNKSVTQHYIDRKNGEESVDYYHQSLEPSLNSSFGEMIYQEQAMSIAKNIAGFSLQESDNLRKSLGKKLASEMAKVKIKFLEGTQKVNIVTQEEAEKIFGWIEKSQRYAFNKSHSISYSVNTYLSAYAKAHFPKMFFKAYLKFARDKIDPHAEIKGLVQNATEMDIIVRPPDIRLTNEYFIIHNGDIYFGLRDIKGLGDSAYKKFIKIKDKIEKSGKTIGECSWLETLFTLLQNVNSTAAKAIIECGAMPYIKKTRSSMLFEYQLAEDLTVKELSFVMENLGQTDLGVLLEKLLKSGKVHSTRIKSITDKISLFKKPPHSLLDSIDWLTDVEYNILGCSITCSKVDMCDLSMTNVSCRDLKTGLNAHNIILGGEIENVNTTITKKGKTAGQEMAFMEMSDGTGVADNIIIFPETYKKYRQLLFLGNIIVVVGNKSNKGDSLIVDKVYLAKT